jgi:hypothetical protein
MERTQIFEWFSWFRRGENGRRLWRLGRISACRTDENMENVQKIAKGVRRSTISDIAGRFSLVWNMPAKCEHLERTYKPPRCVCDYYSLTSRSSVVYLCARNCSISQINPYLLSRVVTEDETWDYCYEPEARRQSSWCKSRSCPRPTKARDVC